LRQRDDADGQRDVLSFESIGGSAAIPPFVQLAKGTDDRVAKVQSGGEPLGDFAVTGGALLHYSRCHDEPAGYVADEAQQWGAGVGAAESTEGEPNDLGRAALVDGDELRPQRQFVTKEGCQ